MGTTALVGVALLTAGQAMAAERPTARLEGYYDFFYAFTDEDADTATNEYADTVFFVDYGFGVYVRGVADNGLEYGAKFEVNPSEPTVRDEAAMYLENAAFGTIELGQTDGAAAKMAVFYDAPWGIGGANGDYDEIAQAGDAAGGGVDLVGGDMSLGDSTKISYYSPRFAGLDFGLSYVLTSNETDDARNHRDITGGGNASQESQIQMALRYTRSFSGVDFQTGVTYASITTQENRTASVNTQAFEDPSGFQAGLAVSMGGWTVAGGYEQWQDVLTANEFPAAANKGASVDDATSFNIGVHYETGPWVIGANFYAEEAEGSAATAANQENEAYGLGFNYALAEGLALVGEVTFFEATGDAATPQTNDGTVIVIGTQFSF